MATSVIHITKELYGNAKGVIFVDIPAVAKRLGLPGTPRQRRLIAAQVLEELRDSGVSTLVIAKMSGVGVTH